MVLGANVCVALPIRWRGRESTFLSFFMRFDAEMMNAVDFYRLNFVLYGLVHFDGFCFVVIVVFLLLAP